MFTVGSNILPTTQIIQALEHMMCTGNCGTGSYREGYTFVGIMIYLTGQSCLPSGL